MTLTDRFVLALAAAGRSRRTARLYVLHAWRMARSQKRRPDAAWTAAVTTSQVRAWVDSARGEGTQRLRLSAARSFFGWAVAEGLRRRDPTRGVSVHWAGPVHARADNAGRRTRVKCGRRRGKRPCVTQG
jgi:site-specific recombinase XerC